MKHVGTTRSIDFCRVDGCLRSPFRQGLCQGHMKRAQRGQPIEHPLGELVWDQIHLAILAYQDAETDAEHDRLLLELTDLMRRWVKSGCPMGAFYRQRRQAR